MPRSAGITVDNNFVRGLVTEATGLSFPENACTETFDCIFKKTGEVTRRKGLDYEASYSLFTLTASRSNSAISTYKWVGAGGDSNSTFVVVQVGQYLYFYKIADALSTGKHSTSVDLSSFAVSGNDNPYSYECRFSQGDGKLFVVSPVLEPFFIEYTPSTDTISSGTAITIKVRDTNRLTTSYTQRPTATATNVEVNHIYNLWNAGWNSAVEVDSGGTADPIQDWDSSRSDFPGPGDSWWYFKDSNNDFSLNTIAQVDYSQTEVPVGKYIWNAFNVNRPAATFRTNGNNINTQYTRSDQSSLPVDSTSKRPKAVAFFANRVFYAGVEDEGYNSKIFFSQILTDINKAGLCYQENDPTSETLSDLLATDGGVILVPEIANVVHMEETQGALTIWATNGIWQITGSEGIGFTAVDFTVRRISTLQNVANKSFVNLNGIPAWINGEGVWLLQEDRSLGSTNVTSLSKDSIQTWFEDNVPAENIPYIKGVYNQRERLIYWLFKSNISSSLDGSYQYDRCLVFNTETGAFYPWKLNTTTNIKVISAVVSSGFSVDTSVDNVIDSGSDNVIDSNSDQVVTNSITEVSVRGSLKFLTENNSSQITWSEEYDTDYLDWTTPLGTGVNYESYFITGYKVRGEALRKQQTNYIRVHSRVETDSSVKIRGVWDYYTSIGARWSTEQQGYKSGSNTTYTERRLKIRGNGLALQLRFGSEQGKPFNVTGWASFDSIANVP